MLGAIETGCRSNEENSILSDTELLARFKNQRDEPAFAQFVDRHAAMVLGICHRLLGNRADAEDAFQATFFVLAMRLRRHEPPSLPANWLYVVARRTALKAKSAEWRRKARLRRITEMKTHEAYPQEELAGMLDAEIANLPARLRSAAVLCYLEGKTNRQAARMLGWPVGTLATRLRQARDLLRKRLARRGYVANVGAVGATLIRHLPPPNVSPPLALSTTKGAVSLMNGTTSILGASTALHLAKAVARKMYVHHLQLLATIFLVPSLAVVLAVASFVSFKSPSLVAAAPPRASATAPVSKPSTAESPDDSMAHIRRVALAVMVYSGRHNWKFPPDLGAVLPYADGDARLFLSPEDEATTAIPRQPSADWINAHTSFVYLGSAKMNDQRLRQLRIPQPRTILMYQKLEPGSDAPVPVAFFDGHGAWLARPVAEQAIRDSLVRLASMHPGGPHPPVLPPARETPSDPLSVPWQPSKSVELPSDLRKALEDNARDIVPLDVSWEEHAIATVPRDPAISLRLAFPASFSGWSHRAIAQPGRSYRMSKGPKGDTDEQSSDGRIYYSRIFNPNGHTKATLLKNPIAKLRLAASADFLPMDYFDRIGFRTPRFSASGEPDAQSEILWELDHGARLVSVERAVLDQRDLTRVTIVLDNREWRLLHSLPKQKNLVFYLDPLMHYALRRREERYGPRLLSEMDNDDFHRLEMRGIWLPMRSKQNSYTWRSIPGHYFETPIFSDVYEVTQISGQAADEKQFVLEPVVSPTRVTDATVPGKPVTYDSPAVDGAKQP